MARSRRLRAPAPVTLAAIALALAVAGCATAPSGGPPRRVTGGSSQVQAYAQPLPPPAPTRDWTAVQVVLGFLHASASYAFDPAAAMKYLAPSLRTKWHPDNEPVAVVGNTLGISSVPYRPQIPGTKAGEQFETVKYTGQGLATLSQTGRYQYKSGQNVEYDFILAKIGGVWRIQQLPQSQLGLLLTQPDFQAVYQARNLFFYTPQDQLLVPDPVYAPLQSSNSALNTNLATGLVKGLLNGQGDWLSGATSSAFPKNTYLIGQVTITGRTAKVDLGGAAAHVPKVDVPNMEAQLLATLGDRSYSLPLASQVNLYINHKRQYFSATTNADLVPAVATGPVLIITPSGALGELKATPRAQTGPVLRVGPAQIGRAQITAVAAAPPRAAAPQLAVAVRDRTGCAVYLGGGGPYRPYTLATSGGTCTSLSWDTNGNLWAAAGQRIWVLRPQDRRPLAVDVSLLSVVGQAGSRIQALRMAPDGVRAALLVHTRTGNRLLLAAVQSGPGASAVAFGQPVSIGTGVADPIAVSWSDPYHLAVLAGGAIFEVPLTGGAGLQTGGSPLSLGTAPAGAETLTTDGSELVAGTGDGEVFASSLAAPGWNPITTGSSPVYPG